MLDALGLVGAREHISRAAPVTLGVRHREALCRGMELDPVERNQLVIIGIDGYRMNGRSSSSEMYLAAYYLKCYPFQDGKLCCKMK